MCGRDKGCSIFSVRQSFTAVIRLLVNLHGGPEGYPFAGTAPKQLFGTRQKPGSRRGDPGPEFHATPQNTERESYWAASSWLAAASLICPSPIAGTRALPLPEKFAVAVMFRPRHQSARPALSPIKAHSVPHPYTAMCPRIASIVCVRWRTSRSRVRNINAEACSSSLFIATNRLLYIRPLDCLANRLAIGYIVLLALYEWLHIPWHIMPTGGRQLHQTTDRKMADLTKKTPREAGS